MTGSSILALSLADAHLGNPATPWLIPAVAAVLGSTVIAGLFGTVLGNLRAAADIRRDRYAVAVRGLISKVEYPYRIKRRTSDDTKTLSELADRGHDLQESLAQCRGWVAAESPALAAVYDWCLASLDGPVRSACTEAWQAPPVRSAADMNLAGFGPGDQQVVISQMECAIAYRFGWRRALPATVVRRRLQRRCLH